MDSPIPELDLVALDDLEEILGAQARPTIRRLVDTFAKQTAGALSEIRDLTADGALAPAARELHILKGSASQLGLRRLAAEADALRQTILADNRGPSAAQLDQLQAMTDRALEALECSLPPRTPQP